MWTPPARVDARSLRDRLLRDAEILAERTVAVVRGAMALALAALLLASIQGMDLPSHLIRAQVAAALAVLAVYIALAVASWWLAHPDRLHPAMPWFSTTADGGLILVNIAFNAENLGVSLAFATVFAVVWLAPLTLSFTVLRYRPGLQAYGGVLLVGGVAALRWVEGIAPVGPMPPMATFEPPPNLMRLAMFAGCAAILVLAAVR